MVERANVTRLARRLGADGYDDLLQRSVADLETFWATVVGVNLVGMRRAGLSGLQIDAVRRAFRILFRERMVMPAAPSLIPQSSNHELRQRTTAGMQNAASRSPALRHNDPR